MQLDSLLVEVRDSSLTRVGKVTGTELDVMSAPVFNEVGQWTLTLPAESPMVPVLLKPGSGIIVSLDGTTFDSGPVYSYEVNESSDDAGGSIEFTGVSDTIILKDMLAFPQPSNPDAETQNTDVDKRIGPAETVIHGFVNANIGPSAPVPRRNALLVMGYNGGRGQRVTGGVPVDEEQSGRFLSVFDTIVGIATANGLGFRVIQRDRNLVFETYAIADRSGEVRLSVANGSLATNKVSVSAPGVTRVIAGGDGSGKARVIRAYDSPKSLEAESQWGRRIERFVDANQDKVEELATAAGEVLAADGFALVATQSAPIEYANMTFGTDWNVGDIVAVEVSGQEAASIVSGAILIANNEGLRLRVIIGDPVGFDIEARVAAKTKMLQIHLQRQATKNEVPTQTIRQALDDSAEAIFNASPAGISQAIINDESILIGTPDDNVRLSAAGIIGTGGGQPMTTISTATGALTAVSGTFMDATVTGDFMALGGTGNGVRISSDPIIGYDAGVIEFMDSLSHSNGRIFSIGSGSTAGLQIEHSNAAGMYLTIDDATPSDPPMSGVTLRNMSGVGYATLTGDVTQMSSDEIKLISNLGSSFYVGADSAPRVASEAVYGRTYSSAANVYVTGAGTLGRSTSSLRYKDPIGEFTLDDPKAALQLRAHQWHDKGQIERGVAEDYDDPENRPVHTGFFAEEVEAIGGGMEAFVIRDEQGRPDALEESRLVGIALLELARNHEARLTALEGVA